MKTRMGAGMWAELVAGWESSGRSAPEPRPRRCRYRPLAELMMRTFALHVLCCPRCSGRLRLVALMTERKEVAEVLEKRSGG